MQIDTPLPSAKGTLLLRRADLLRDFLAVVAQGGIRAAATSVHLSQSALTRRIQELERELGVELFERHSHGMRLTRFGEVLRHHAQQVDLACQYAVSELDDLRDGGAGELRLAAGPAWAYALVPDAISTVQSSFPKTRFLVSNRHNESTLPLLGDARIDLVLGSLPEQNRRDPAITYEPVLDIEHCVFARASHPLHGHPGLHPRDLRKARWIWFAESVSTRESFHAWYRRARLAPPESAIEITSVQAAIRLMQRADYVMVLPSTLEPVLAEHHLRRLAIGTPIGHYSAGMMYRQSVLRLRVFAELRRHLLALAQEFSAQGRG